MTKPKPKVKVTTAPMIDPGAGRRDMAVAHGLTIAEIVALALPHLSPENRTQARVALVTPQGASIIAPGCWHLVRPHAGVHVVIRLIPQGDALRSILSIVVSVAAVALGGPLAGLIGATGKLGTALVTAGLTVVGNLLITALIPPPKPEETQNRYTISGWRNQLVPDGAIPVVLGRMRYAPPFAAFSYSEIVGDDQFIRSFFLFGEGGDGGVDLSDFRIGETSIGDYDEVEIEVRSGVAGDLPVSLYPRQVAEENIGVELTRPLPRDDLGEVIEGDPSIETPVVRSTGADAAGASVLLAFPGGLIKFTSKGKKRAHTVSVLIEHRRIDAVLWTAVETLEITAKKAEGFYRQHTWEFPTRGRYQVRLTMLTDETENSQIQQRCNWAAIQTLRPEYPLNINRPLALVALRIKATHQINGQLDSFNAIASRVCRDWDHLTETWITRATSNPASLYRFVLQSAANVRPVVDGEIDLDQLADWHDFCRVQDLAYDRVLDSSDSTLRDVLAEIAAAGRASPRHDGLRWGVTIDRPQELVVDHLTPRNSRDFQSRRNYIDPPHAFRVKFKDAENEFKDAERLIRWPGYLGEITITEALELPGKTRAHEVWREARRRMYEAIYRPDLHEVMQDGPVRVATRGDLVMLQSDVIQTIERTARVRAVQGRLVEIDEEIEIGDGDYGVRFRVFADTPSHLPPDTIGTSVVRTLRNPPGATTVLILDGEGPLPLPDDLILFGPATSEAMPMIVAGVEAGEEMSSLMRLVDAAPEIDTLLAADEIPAWSGRVGAEIDDSLLAPPAPRFAGVTSGVSGTDDAGRIDYLIVPGSGAVASSTLDIEHRPTGGGAWTVISIPAGTGGGSIMAYAQADVVELRARALSYTGTPGPYGPVITLTIGAEDAAIPAALEPGALTATSLLGAVQIAVATSADVATTQIQLYRTPGGVPLDRAIHALGAPIPCGPATAVSYTDGDPTRVNLIANGDFASAGSWTLDANWSITAGKAVHAAGVADAIQQAAVVTAGKWYRLIYTISGVTAGTIRPRLTGGTDRPGVAVMGNGLKQDRIDAVTGNNTLRFATGSAFDGALDDVVIWEETATALAAGTYDYYAEPQNEDGVPGPVSGPVARVIL